MGSRCVADAPYIAFLYDGGILAIGREPVNPRCIKPEVLVY